jgi:spore coat polysaccharide biosynthesis protein SpsF (cytidylyltransferase family)
MPHKFKVLGVIQARTSSTRLPNKVMMPILGRPLLALQIERLRRCKALTNIVVATTADRSDNEVVDLCAAENIKVFRGSMLDVLNRFIQAARPYTPDVVVRLTGDCPLTDPDLIDQVIDEFFKQDLDYLGNCNPATFPDGLDVEVFRFAALDTADREAVLPSHREHVTPYIRYQPNRFKVGNYSALVDRSNLRWTVDEPEDFEFVRAVYERLYPRNSSFSTEDILNLLKKEPDLQEINRRFQRNEGSRKSSAADAEYLIKNRNVH